jgi:hypothetical protein
VSALLGIGRRIAHAAALIFGAFWLVATSAVPEPEPARDCFTGIGNPTRLEVRLGSRASSTIGNCAALDGLAENGTLVFDLAQGPRPEEGGDCWGYETQALDGVKGVTLSRELLRLPTLSATSSLTSVSGPFGSPEMPACAGNWALALYPATRPDMELVSPLDAGIEQGWFVERQIRINRGSSCGGLFTETGILTCVEHYAVTSITELPTP